MVEDMRSEIRDAYSRRAAEYAAHLRSMEAVHPADQQLVDTWADQIDGPATGAVGGVLAWYSLIHCEPDEIQVPLREFARVLRPGSDLLIGFFDGPRVKKFEHTVVAAHRWPVDELCDKLRAVDFDVIETHLRTGPQHRPYGAILARRWASR